jgi:ribose transport system permease protein
MQKPAKETGAPAARSRLQAGWRKLTRQWILLILIAFILFFSISARGFLTVRGLRNIAVFTSEPLLLALGQTFVIISGGIDLSVGAVLGFCGIVSALVLKASLSAALPVPLGILFSVMAGLITGTLLGTINGTIIAKLKVPAFVVTLGMLGIARGSTYIMTAGHAIIGLPAELSEIGNRQLFGVVPVSVVITIVLALIMHFLLSRTRLGRYTYAIGGGRQASVRAGVPVDRYTIAIYALCGFTAAWAGILILARFGTGSPIAGLNDELDAIAAVVIGGASLHGGIGNIGGTVIGSLIIGVLLVGLVILNVQPYWQMVSVGFILIAAVFIDNIRYRRIINT